MGDGYVQSPIFPPTAMEDIDVEGYNYHGNRNYGYDESDMIPMQSAYHYSETEVDHPHHNEPYYHDDEGDPPQRRDSTSSSMSYVPSDDDLDDVKQREILAANLDDPNYILDLLPSRTLGRGILKSTGSSKWVRGHPSLRRRKGHASEEGADNMDSEQVEEIVSKIIKDTEKVDGTKGAAVKRRNTIRQISSSIKTKRTIRNEVAKKAKKKKAEKTSPFTACWYSVSYSLGGLKERISDWASSLSLWESSIKKIEGNYGSSVTSFFILLRWLLYLNIVVFLLTFCLIVIPELVYLNKHGQKPQREDFEFLDLITGGGWMANSSMFYGYYTNEQNKYNVSLAYLLVYSACYILILIVLIKSISQAYRQYFVTGDNTHGFYSSKVFTGWDFGVTSEETAKLKQRSIYLELAESLSLKVKDGKRSAWRKCGLFFLRIFTNLVVLAIIAGACILIIYMYQKNFSGTSIEVLSELAVPLLVAGYNLILPYMFTVITNVERYKNPRNALYMALFRVFLMKVVVLVTLIVFWLQQVNSCQGDINVEREAACQCWETFAGQEIYKLVIIDFIVQFLATALGELFFAIGRRFCCKGLTPPEFNIARNTMDLIQAQAYTWIGMYFSPLLMVICIIKVVLTFYVKRTSVLYNCKPSKQAWRASLAKTVFLIILYIFFGICGFSVGYILAQLKPSESCGPFRGEESPFSVLLNVVDQWTGFIETILKILTSPGFVLAIIIVLILAIYYFRTVKKGRRKIIKRLKQQITLEGKDKRFLLKRLRDVVSQKTVSTKDSMRHRRMAEQDQAHTGGKAHQYKKAKDQKQRGYQNVEVPHENVHSSDQHISYPGVTHLTVGSDIVFHSS
ncbi:Transmembrane channel-like protein 5 [Holothuria leucospilota]|uniref:Transmembrane channel-like protein 5 n=1 Tax=Holothuria leucospilota TaxID=206669 RepID=A0A9Q1H9P8_HOLLE|nr:Transmembrane channel-like protein 5 [Holothuria leucospilota]